MNKTDTKMLSKRLARLARLRAPWESLWQDCYAYCLPQRQIGASDNPGRPRTDHLFDGTAPDAVDQLAASLLAQLAPPWSRWFGLAAGRDISDEEHTAVARELDAAAEAVQGHFDRSNLAIELHQCFLDLVTGGTASLLFEEAPAGSASAFRFAAVPLAEIYVDEGPEGRLDVSLRKSSVPAEIFRTRFPKAVLDPEMERRIKDEEEVKLDVVEAVVPDGHGYRYTAFRPAEDASAPGGDGGQVLASGRFETSPFVNFRWMKAPGERWGRSPVMKALPDIKTANKVVELVLKNASIAVTGIWQADDDGVINPANIRLAPGTIIPKAVGSSGLTPLQAPGRFDVSQLVLNDLRARIRHALLVDKLGPLDGPRMTATEVLQRNAEMSRILGATYGRLRSELIGPLVDRALAILRRRGEIPDIRIDGRTVEFQHRSPPAQTQAREDASNLHTWIALLGQLGPGAQAALDPFAAAQWSARALGVPNEVVRAQPPAPVAGGIDELVKAMMGNSGAAAGTKAPSMPADAAPAGAAGMLLTPAPASAGPVSPVQAAAQQAGETDGRA
ncbi:MAG: portal protein [Bauldia litoralis]